MKIFGYTHDFKPITTQEELKEYLKTLERPKGRVKRLVVAKKEWQSVLSSVGRSPIER